MISMAQRIQLADFLRSCRARLAPAEVGLPEPSRRRRPGLRREDVAALAEVSVTWYTWLEQGREVQASARTLECLSRVLRLTPDERDYLFALAQNRPPPLEPPRTEAVRPAVQRMLDALSVPALVMSRRWDVVAWNRMMTLVLRDYGAIPPGRRNLLKLVLANRSYRADPAEYARIARRVLSKFKIDYSHAAGDPAFDTLVAELEEICPLFHELWQAPDVVGRSEASHSVEHPRFGRITLEHTSYVVEGSPDLVAIIFVPVGAESRAKIARIAQSELSSVA